jgi:diguanylate cyclase (GGDEF)-like protein
MTTNDATVTWAGGSVLGSEHPWGLPSRMVATPAVDAAMTRPALDEATRRRRDAIITQQVARETPWVMLVLTLLIILFDVASATAGLIAPVGYYVSDVIQGGFFLVVVILCRRHIMPATSAPWLFASAIVINVAALSYQHTVDPSGNAIGVILMTTVLFGGLLAMWRPFLVSSVIIVAVVSLMLFRHDPAGAMPWVIAMFTGIGASAALLFARRRSATELAIAQRAYEGMATHDQATGLLNRHGLLAATGHLVSTARRNGEPVFAVFVDVVGLKSVNDRHGHHTGDLVISRCADAVMLASRDCDLVARWGGDEFVVIGIGPEPGREVYAHRIVAALDVTGLEGQWSGCVSVGTASCDDHDVLSVIDGADADMYASRPTCAESVADGRPEEEVQHVAQRRRIA